MLVVEEDSLDDVLRGVMRSLLDKGAAISPTKGRATELIGASITLRNPRARVSRSQGRSPLFSALGELLWYLSGDDDVERVARYIPMYRGFAVDGRVEGAYGPRLFGAKGRLDEVIERMVAKRDSRQAVVQVFDHADLGNQKDIPCTTTLQFFLRESQLHLAATMRSNDAYRGLPHDIFAFTMLQEITARKLGVEIGKYYHFVGSLHLYDSDLIPTNKFLAEGWHQGQAMPVMPAVDPTEGIAWLLDFEARLGGGVDVEDLLGDLGDHPYWDDLARVLLIHAATTEESVNALRSGFDEEFFAIYADDLNRRRGASR